LLKRKRDSNQIIPVVESPKKKSKKVQRTASQQLPMLSFASQAQSKDIAIIPQASISGQNNEVQSQRTQTVTHHQGPEMPFHYIHPAVHDTILTYPYNPYQSFPYFPSYTNGFPFVPMTNNLQSRNGYGNAPTFPHDMNFARSQTIPNNPSISQEKIVTTTANHLSSSLNQ
jgi:hypothetical protein